MLKLYVGSLPNGTPTPVALFTVGSDSWAETGITWNSQPGVGPNLGSVNLGATGWVVFDVTAFVNQKLALNKMVSLLLQDTTQANKMAQFNSRENSVNRPVLEVTP